MLAQKILPIQIQEAQAHFQAERLMAYLGAKLLAVRPGHVTIELPYGPAHTLPDGNFHTRSVVSVIDTACSCAAYTHASPGVGMRTVAYKVNILERTRGEKVIVHGRVLRAGHKVTMCHGEALIVREGQEQLFATMLATMMIGD